MVTCDVVQKEIQLVFDFHGSLSKTAREHLEVCIECRELYSGYHIAQSALRDDVAATIQSMGTPDLSFIQGTSSRKETHGLKYNPTVASYLPRAAAILAIVLIPFVSYVTYEKVRIRNLIKGDAASFISQLYEGAYFQNISLVDDFDLSENLFSGIAGVSEYDIAIPIPVSEE